jgi:hypothetical protein
MENLLFKLALILIISVSFTTALYDTKSDVVKLTTSNFQKEVVNSNDIWLVEFYGK